jgi:hypothetical protein
VLVCVEAAVAAWVGRFAYGFAWADDLAGRASGALRGAASVCRAQVLRQVDPDDDGWRARGGRPPLFEPRARARRLCGAALADPCRARCRGMPRRVVRRLIRRKAVGVVQGEIPSIGCRGISASAPLLAFRGERPEWDTSSYYRVITNTAASYSPACSSNIRAMFPLLADEGKTAAGRARLGDAFRLCRSPATPYKVEMLKYFVRDVFDSLAMGNYPYISGTARRPMQAWPMKHACAALENPGLAKADPAELFPLSQFRSQCGSRRKTRHAHVLLTVLN